MNTPHPEDFDTLIGDGTGKINPNQTDFQQLRQAIEQRADEMDAEQRLRLQLLGLKYRMDTYLQQDQPPERLTAGDFLKACVEATGVSHAHFARYLNVQPANLSAIYHGKRRISQELALKLGALFEMNPATWLYLQSKAELLALQQTEPDKYAAYRLTDLLAE